MTAAYGRHHVTLGGCQKQACSRRQGELQRLTGRIERSEVPGLVQCPHVQGSPPRGLPTNEGIDLVMPADAATNC